MKLRRLLPWSIAAALVMTAAWHIAQPQPARACGGFFSRKDLKAKPSLSLERVLIVHDASAGKQHFIRQVAFKAAKEPFGFVVPTPSRPEVAKVTRAPFDPLSRDFPFQPKPQAKGRRGAGAGFGSGHGRLGGMQVLEQKKVGSFTAFVLAAQDEKALANWLSEQGLVSSPEADRWLAHYVRMQFFYVAMRYDPPNKEKKDQPKDKTKADAVQAETLRISFDTPLPYYPYFEPELSKGATAAAERAMELWLVTSEPMTPIAAVRKDDQTQWVRPLKAGMQHDDARTDLIVAIGKELEPLLPAGKLVVHTFQDQKTSRSGYGDILFAPQKARALSDKEKQKLTPLLPILAPALLQPP